MFGFEPQSQCHAFSDFVNDPEPLPLRHALSVYIISLDALQLRHALSDTNTGLGLKGVG